jgi:hypothetical protein
MNYRSVVALGQARLVTDPEEKMTALGHITNHLAPGRWEEARLPNEKEVKSTTVVALTLDEVSAKVRTGPPIDDEEDYALPVWAGVVPLRIEAGEPAPDARLLDGIPAIDRRRFTSRHT